MISKVFRPVLVPLALMSGSLFAATDDNVTWRPIEDFLKNQGSYCLPDGYGGCFEILPGISRNFLGISDSDTVRCGVVDYAGIVAEYLAQKSGGAIDYKPTISGTVKERALKDGSAEITVVLHAEQAITWVCDNCDVLRSPVYGSRYDEILGGAVPSLSDETLEATFINTAPGDPLPDLVFLAEHQYNGPQQLLSLSLIADGNGFLRFAFGVPDGTHGRIHATTKAKTTPSAHRPYLDCRIDLSIAPLGPAGAHNVSWRPIEDFLNAQGTYCWRDNTTGECTQFLPGIERNFATVSDLETDPIRCGVVDYAGIVAEYLAEASDGRLNYGTTSWGSVKERVLDDGTTEVSVMLHTEQAITWVVEGCDLTAGPFLYGRTYKELLDGAEASLSDVTLSVTFTNTAPGAPLPDILYMYDTPGITNPVMLSFAMITDGRGQLRSGYGVPDGTPGRIHTVGRSMVTGSGKKAILSSSIDLSTAPK